MYLRKIRTLGIRGVMTMSARPSPPKFHQSADAVRKETAKVLENTKAQLDNVAKAPANSLALFAEAENKMTSANNVLSFYQYVSEDDSLRKASEEAEQAFSDLFIEIYKREDVFESLQKVGTPSNKVDQRYLQKVLKDFKRNGLGVGLSEEDKKELTRLEMKLTSLCIKYNSNIGNDNSFEVFTEEELKGVPASAMEQYARTPEGGYKVTYKAPELTPVLKHCDVEATRKKMWLGYENIVPENEPLFKETLELRQKVAKILGYKTHAEYVLAERMAQTPEKVKDFLEDLVKRAQPLGKVELAQFEQVKGSKVYAWDVSWCQNKIVENEFAINQEEIQQYFPTLETVKRMFGIFEKVMNLEFVEVELEPDQKWHKDVTCFAISEAGEFKGYLYLDMYPRENKYNHFANFSLLQGFVDSTGTQLPASALVCNFPSSGLLQHQDVVTFFHELGHGIHATLGLTPYARFSGTSVVRDFVETPSQLLEYWTWDPEQLRVLSCQKDTKEPLPSTLLNSLVRSKKANNGSFVLRQLFFGLFDLEAHTSSNFDPKATWRRLRDEVIGISSPEDHAGYNHFAHIMGGYDCGYYGYMWSQVYAADIWHSLFEANPMDPVVGSKYRDLVLARGGSVDANEMLKELLGREPNSVNFHKELGLQQKL